MRTIRAFLVLLFFFGMGLQQWSYGQELDFKKYSVSHGLPQSQVHDIAQTSDGYIWMTTYGGGLTKFDGQEFVTFTTRDGLKDNAVEDILVDDEDNIWVSTSKGGVATFQGDSLVYPFSNHPMNNIPMTDIFQLNNGDIWFCGYQEGIFAYDGDDISKITKKDGLASNTIWNVYEAEQGKIWIATAEGLSLFDGKSFQNYTTEDGIPGESIYSVTGRDNGEIWLATNKGVAIWDRQVFDELRTDDGESLGSTYDVIETSDGAVWMGTESDGIYRYKNGDLNHITQKNGLSSNYIYEFFEDRNNNLWIATDEDGVNLFKDEGFTFFSGESGLTSDGIFNIYRDQDKRYWLGTADGIFSYDGDSFMQHKLPGDYENQYIWNITGLPDGSLLIGMPDYTLMTYDGQSYSNFSEEYGLGSLYVYDFFVDSDNILWICAESGLYRVNLKSKATRHYTVEDGLASDQVFTMYEDQQGAKWIGTNYGLSIYDGTDFKNIRVEDGLVHNQVDYITADKQNHIWLGTGGGISEYIPAEGNKPAKINNFDKNDGMLLVTTHFLWFDEDGYLWQGTNAGLQSLDVPTYRQTGEMSVQHYALSDQGIGLEFNYHALFSEAPNVAWMGSMEGAVKLNTNKLQRNSKLQGFNFTQISVNSVPVNWENYEVPVEYKNGQIKFPSVAYPTGKNNFRFDFQGLSYVNPENIQYRFKLEGFEDQWMPVTKDNSAVYTSLSPGEYEFVVEAKTGSGNFSDNRIAYSFSIAYPFYRSYLFYALAGILLIGLIYGYIRIRIGYLEKNRLEQLVEERTQHLKEALEEKEVLIKEIHHRVKNNLAVISGILELQIDHAQHDHASKVLRDGQQRIQSIAMIHEKLYQSERLAEIDFAKYVEELVEVIVRSHDKQEKNIKVDVQTGGVKLGVDQGIPCGLIINELLSNAYEHAFEGRKEGNILVRFKHINENQIQLIVRDDGVGLPGDYETMQQQTETLGMGLVSTLVRQLEGEIEVNSLDQGTEFIVEFQKEKPSLKVPVN